MSNMYDVLDRILDKGLTLSFENSNLCCPDCLQTQYYSAAVPASPMLTTHEINDENYRIYSLASVDTTLVLFEQINLLPSPAVPASPLTYIDPNSKLDCCLHVEASVETTLKLSESLGYDIPNNFQNCTTNFNTCVDDLLSLFNSESIDVILDRGIVEYGSISGQSQICLLKDFVNLAYDSQDKLILTKAEILEKILDKGIVVSCYNGEMSISSVETFWKWYEGYIDASPAALPA